MKIAAESAVIMNFIFMYYISRYPLRVIYVPFLADQKFIFLMENKTLQNNTYQHLPTPTNTIHKIFGCIDSKTNVHMPQQFKFKIYVETYETSTCTNLPSHYFHFAILH